MSHTYRKKGFFSHRDHVAGTRRAQLVARSCHGKIPYPSKRTAAATVREMLADGRARPGYDLQVYKCKTCGRWHVGNSRQQRRAS